MDIRILHRLDIHAHADIHFTTDNLRKLSVVSWTTLNGYSGASTEIELIFRQ